MHDFVIGSFGKYAGGLSASFMALMLILAFPAQARWICVDPLHDPEEQDRICERTERSLDLLLSSGTVVGGDRILLKAGRYGDLTIKNRHSDRRITISSYPRHEAILSSVHIENSSNWTLSELTVEPGPGVEGGMALITITPDSHAIRIKDSTIRSSSTIDAWSRLDWMNKARTGVEVAGRDIRIERTRIENVRSGIISRADDSLFIGNTIIGFTEDGIRGLGDGTVYAENRISSCYQVDAYQSYAFRSWSIGEDGQVGTGTVRKGTLSGNTVIGTGAGEQEYACSLSGIGMFDGYFDEWIIERNIVAIDNWHGITVMGGRDVRISENVVVDLTADAPGPPWIAITNHKDGRPSEESEISRNMVQLQGGVLTDGSGYNFGSYQTGVTRTDSILVSGLQDDRVQSFLEIHDHKRPTRVLTWLRN